MFNRTSRQPPIEEYSPPQQMPDDYRAVPGSESLFNPPSDMHRTIKELLNDDMVAELKKTTLWPVLCKSFILTFIPREDRFMWTNLFEAAACSYLRSLPPGDSMNGDKINMLNQARFMFHTNLARATGTDNSNKINERTAQISQIRFGMSSAQLSQTRPGGGSFIGRLFGRGK